MFRRIQVHVTTDASGDATVYSTPITGRIFSISYVKDDFGDGSTFAITLCNIDKTAGPGDNIWSESNVNASAVRCPRQPTHDYQGAASLFAASGEPVEDYIIACNERVKIVISSGGNTKSGDFYIKVG